MKPNFKSNILSCIPVSTIRKRQNKEQRWMKDQDHKISGKIVDFAKDSQVSAIRLEALSSRAEIARDEAYRKLAEEAVSVQQKMAEDQQRIAKDLSEMKDRIYAIEKMLSDVG